MIFRILTAFLIFVLVALIAMFFLEDAPKEIARRKNVFENPLAFLFEESGDSGETFSLSFEPIEVPTIMLEDTLGKDASILASPIGESGQEELLEAEQQYDERVAQLEETKVFGTPSPLRDAVSFSYILGGTTASDPREEYIAITANHNNTAPVPIDGWSLQSVVSGKRVFFPPAVRIFEMGEINSLSNVALAPGARAIIHSGVSPVGVSFQENICSGYLNQFQKFTPALARDCPLPAHDLPPTVENIRSYGDACIEFVAELPHCELYLDTFPDDTTPQCQTFVREALSYNGCVGKHQWRASFPTGNWRIFLGTHENLWRDTRDVIRLLDVRGRTVDVLSY